MLDGHTAEGQRRLFRWLLAGAPGARRIESLEVAGVDASELVYSPLWLPDRPLRVYGRTLARDDLQLELTVGTGPQTTRHQWQLSLEPDNDDRFLGRQWAQQRLQQLQRRQQQEELSEEAARQQISELSQEWSVLSPYTAFLVLESEQDYQRWNIQRRPRRQYWEPAGRVPVEPLPEQWLARVRPAEPPPEDRHLPFEQMLQQAREAVQAGQFDVAHDLLEQLRKAPQAADDDQYATLAHQALEGLRDRQRLQRLRQLRQQYPLFAPSRPEGQQRPVTLSSLLGGFAPLPGPGQDSRFNRAHVEMDVPSGNFTLQTLSQWLEDLAGVPVDLDRRALEDSGIAADVEVQFGGYGRLGADSFFRYALEQLHLNLLEDEERLLITTRKEAERRQTASVYPVSDLLIRGRVASDEQLLLDLFQQRRQQAERRLQQKLNRPMHCRRAVPRSWKCWRCAASRLPGIGRGNAAPSTAGTPSP